MTDFSTQLDGKINLDVECNPIQAETVKGVIEKMEAGEEFEARTLVEEQAFCAPGIESEYAVQMTQEILDGTCILILIVEIVWISVRN